MFQQIIKGILSFDQGDFKKKTEELRHCIDQLEICDFRKIVKHIGTIPECIEHDSTEEKLYSKTSDIVLARCFRELGLAARALNERADSADILAESVHGYHYSLVADAKCFRLSRTAKNQKDFKVSNLSDWRGAENEYAVLVAPYFQYPQIKSQIYSKALEYNVCLLSWEHIFIMLEHGIRETNNFSMESLWNASAMMARDKHLSFINAQSCFLPRMDEYVAKKAGLSQEQFKKELYACKEGIFARGQTELLFWERKINEIQSYTREEAIEELIAAKKLNEKRTAIEAYLLKLGIREHAE